MHTLIGAGGEPGRSRVPATLGASAVEQFSARVGERRYRDACTWAWKTAAGTGRRCAIHSGWPDGLQSVPHELADLWYEPTPIAQRLRLGLHLYRDMPCYANTTHLVGFHAEYGAAERSMLWDAYRQALQSASDELADPIAHALFADAFQDERLVQEAWLQTTRRDVEPWERRIERLLAIAGPVPWSLKAALLDELAVQPSWHASIFRALADSTFQSQGQLERRPAARLLDRLTLAADTHDLLALRAHLGLT